VKRSTVAAAGLTLGLSAIAAAGAESSQDRDYRASEVCIGNWAVGGIGWREARLVVHTVDPLGMPLPGARVAVEQAGKKIAGPDTDAAGHAVLETLAAGDARLRVDMDGFIGVDVAVRMRQDCITAVLVPMDLGRLDNTDPVPTGRRQP
jgi:hypothetical protein